MITWSIAAGALPPGLSLDAASGVIAGSPTMAGSYSVTVQVTDGLGNSGQKTYALTVLPASVGNPLLIAPDSIPAGVVGQAYRVQLIVANAAAPARVNGIFPPDHALNTPIDKAPLLANSDAIIAQILAQASAASRPATCKPGFDMPINYGSFAARTVLVDDASGQSDLGPFPVPDSPALEGGADNHCLVVDTATDKLFELWQYRPGPPVGCSSAAVWPLGGYYLRALWDTSADGAGLPLAPLVVQFAEFAAGAIRHAVRCTVQKSRKWGSYGGLATAGDADPTQAGNTPPANWPARHRCGTETDAATPAMGERLRLKASFDDSGLSAETRIFTKCFKTYGLIVADNGHALWFNCDSLGWSAALIDKLTTELRDKVPVSAFEVVDGVTPYIIAIDSGQAKQL